MKLLYLFAIIFAACNLPHTYIKKNQGMPNPMIKQVGDPFRATEPNNFNRSIWTMKRYKNRVYLGHGNFASNSGPIPIVSFRNKGDWVKFEHEITVDEEAVTVLRVYDKKLYVPGIDATEPWAFGNYYVKDRKKWTKYRNIPNGVHVFDIAKFKGDLYAYVTSGGKKANVYRSPDGENWTPIFDRSRGGKLYVIGDYLVTPSIIDYCQFIFWDGTSVHEGIKPEICPRKALPFGDKLIYSTGGHYDTSGGLYMMDRNSNPKKIDLPEDDIFVMDMIARRNKIFVLTVKNTNKNSFAIYRWKVSSNKWKKLAENKVPAVPFSFEKLGRFFYLGLGCAEFWNPESQPFSGTIWQVSPDLGRSTSTIPLPFD
jgi:hypothetical protein